MVFGDMLGSSKNIEFNSNLCNALAHAQALEIGLAVHRTYWNSPLSVIYKIEDFEYKKSSVSLFFDI